MKILLTGATGFIGSKIAEKLLLDGHELVCLTRNKDNAYTKLPLPVNFVEWDEFHTNADKYLSDVEGVFHLAGENVGEKKWSEKQKEQILGSRKKITSNLIELINTYAEKCTFFIGASAIGFYPDSIADSVITESTPSDNTFLAKVCVAWEEATNELKPSIRKSLLRIGVVLGHDGGMLKKLLPIYRLAGGGPVGSGQQWMSWIHVDDVVNMLIFAMNNSEVEGIFNAVSPRPIRYKEFNQILAKYVQRPALFKVPGFMLKLIMGEASILALSSQNISCEKIQKLGFNFQYETMDEALKNICQFQMLPPANKKLFHHYVRRVQYIEKPIDEVFIFFKKATNLEQITPPFLNFRVLEQSTKEIQEGTRFKYQLKLHGLPVRWTTIITEWKENERFVDYQKTGPYHIWYHRHLFTPMGKGTLMIDEVRYRLPFGILGELFAMPFVKKDVNNIFNYRQEVIGDLL